MNLPRFSFFSLPNAWSIRKTDINSCLAKQVFWKVNIPTPNKIKILITKWQKLMRSIGLICFMYSIIPLKEKHTKYILTGVDAALRYKAVRTLKIKKSKVYAFKLRVVYKKGVFKYPKVFQCNNESEFKSDMTRLLEKHNVVIWRTTKYKRPHTAFVKVFLKQDERLTW